MNVEYTGRQYEIPSHIRKKLKLARRPASHLLIHRPASPVRLLSAAAFRLCKGRIVAQLMQSYVYAPFIVIHGALKVSTESPSEHAAGLPGGTACPHVRESLTRLWRFILTCGESGWLRKMHLIMSTATASAVPLYWNWTAAWSGSRVSYDS